MILGVCLLAIILIGIAFMIACLFTKIVKLYYEKRKENSPKILAPVYEFYASFFTRAIFILTGILVFACLIPMLYWIGFILVVIALLVFVNFQQLKMIQYGITVARNHAFDVDDEIKINSKVCKVVKFDLSYTSVFNDETNSIEKILNKDILASDIEVINSEPKIEKILNK